MPDPVTTDKQQVDVEVNSEGAVEDLETVASAAEDAAEALERLDTALDSLGGHDDVEEATRRALLSALEAANIPRQ